MNNLWGKRFLFAVIMGVCGSIVTIWLKYPDVSYIKLVGMLTGIFVAGQTYSDVKEKQNGGLPK